VKCPDFVKQRRGIARPLAKQIEPNYARDERTKSRSRYKFDRPARDAQEIAALAKITSISSSLSRTNHLSYHLGQAVLGLK
jgi:hypothetical protein